MSQRAELIPSVMESQSRFYYLAARDAGCAMYERVLEFMIFSIIRGNPRIRHRQLLALLATFNVPTDLAERSLRMCIAPAAAIPNSPNQRLVFVNVNDSVKNYMFNKHVQWDEFVAAYSDKAGFDLSSFQSPVYRSTHKDED